LNKNNKYRDQIEFRTLTLICGIVDTWTFKKNLKNFNFLKKNKIKNSKKPGSDMWHVPRLTRVHLKKI